MTKTVETFDDAIANLKPEDFLNGSTLENVESRSLELCKTYIGGSWNRAKVDDLEVSRIAGGLTNQLYKVVLKTSKETSSDSEEPRQAAIKFYQPKNVHNFSENESERLSDVIILTILSQLGIGPKVYGIFNDGVIQEYFEHEQFRVKQQQQPKLVRQLMSHLAQISYLNVPVPKNIKWFQNMMRTYLDKSYANPEVLQLIQELKLDLLSTRDLREELTDFERILQECNAPLVFCHNDFRGSNILVSTRDQNTMKLVDLEYSAYGYRGHDLANILIEWGRENIAINIELPDDSLIEKIVGIFIEECDKLMPGYSAKPENSLKTIVKETKVMMLAHFMFFMCFMIKQDKSFIQAVPFDRKMNLKFIENTYAKYLVAKKQLIQDGTIKPCK